MAGAHVRDLKKYSLFDGLSDGELKKVGGVVGVAEVAAGTLIVKEGDVGEDMYLLEEGVVNIYKTLTIVTSRNEFGSKERSFTRLDGSSHCYFGEMSLFGSGVRSATVEAVTTCTLYTINDNAFRTLGEDNPRIGYIVVKNIALTLTDYLRKTNEDVIKLTTALSLALSGDK